MVEAGGARRVAAGACFGVDYARSYWKKESHQEASGQELAGIPKGKKGHGVEGRSGLQMRVYRHPNRGVGVVCLQRS